MRTRNILDNREATQQEEFISIDSTRSLFEANPNPKLPVPRQSFPISRHAFSVCRRVPPVHGEPWRKLLVSCRTGRMVAMGTVLCSAILDRGIPVVPSTQVTRNDGSLIRLALSWGKVSHLSFFNENRKVL